jgi:hypothetical protein
VVTVAIAMSELVTSVDSPPDLDSLEIVDDDKCDVIKSCDDIDVDDHRTKAINTDHIFLRNELAQAAILTMTKEYVNVVIM